MPIPQRRLSCCRVSSPLHLTRTALAAHLCAGSTRSVRSPVKSTAGDAVYSLAGASAACRAALPRAQLAQPHSSRSTNSSLAAGVAAPRLSGGRVLSRHAVGALIISSSPMASAPFGGANGRPWVPLRTSSAVMPILRGRNSSAGSRAANRRIPRRHALLPTTNLGRLSCLDVSARRVGALLFRHRRSVQAQAINALISRLRTSSGRPEGRCRQGRRRIQRQVPRRSRYEPRSPQMEMLSAALAPSVGDRLALSTARPDPLLRMPGCHLPVIASTPASIATSL